MGDIALVDVMEPFAFVQFQHLPQLQDGEYRLLYYADYYDGPLSGMLLWKDERLWFTCFDQNGEVGGWYRRFAVYRLTPTCMKWETERNDTFVRLVGDHNSYQEGASSGTPTGSNPDEYYRLYPPTQREPLVGQLVGWFEE